MLTLAKQQPARTDFLSKSQGKELATGSRSPPDLSPRMTQITEPNMVRIPKMTDPSIARIPKCARCRNHGIDCELKGHKEKCQFKNCSCRSCLVVVERQKVTATRVAHLRHQRKLAIKRGSDTADYRSRNPLTEEEELLLSRHLQNKSTEDPEYKRYKQSSKNSERYSDHYTDVIPPFSNTKACMLLREAQSAYSYFYGKCYYPDEKNDRYPDQVLSYNHSKHYDGKYYRDIDNHSPTYSKSFKSVCIRSGDDYEEKYGKYANSRPVIAPRVMRLDENQYYREYFKTEKRDYYYEEKLAPHSTPPPLSKYDRVHGSNLHGNSRHIEPLKVSNTLEKDATQNREDRDRERERERCKSPNISKRLEVLMVMFPEIKEERLKEFLSQHNSDIQSTVQYLLKLKKSPSSASDDNDVSPTSRSSSYSSPHSHCGDGGYPVSSQSEHSTENTVKEEKKPVTEHSSDAPHDSQELSAFTAVHRSCAR